MQVREEFRGGVLQPKLVPAQATGMSGRVAYHIVISAATNAGELLEELSLLRL